MQGQNNKINLLLAIHCHQPVSNFPGIFQDAYEKAYLPFLDRFEDFSNIKISLHYSGSLLDWLIHRHPEFIKRLRLLIEEKRIELIGGGYFEPILSIIPEKDAVAQVAMFKERINEVFGYESKGIWLTERVWEPKLPEILSESKTKFTIVDDYHFKILGLDVEKLNGYYICEEQLRTVLIFPGSEKLRYLIPFKYPQETIDYLSNRLNSAARDLAITFADDGEKFGLWPGTNKWVYKEKWLENFFRALEDNRDWINTITFSEFISKSGPTDRVYLSCTSYREMQEWSGGFFRNFLVKYPEANNMQKKMFSVSEKFTEIENKYSFPLQDLALIRQHLYKGQFNDVYWHGIFGGLYLTHLRGGAYENLIKAENLIEKLDKQIKQIIQCDFDKDGKDELIISNKKMRLYFRPEEGATISEWDDKLKCLNLTNTICRRFEYYHQQLKEKLQSSSNQDREPESIHKKRPVRQEGLEQMLLYDRYNRYSLRNYLLDGDTTLDNFYKCDFKEVAGFSNGPYEVKNKSDDKQILIEFSKKEIINMGVLQLKKIVSIVDDTIYVEYCLNNFGTKDFNFIFGTEFNFFVYDSQFSTSVAEEENLDNLIIHDLWSKAKIIFSLNPAARLWGFPIETISDSEQGIEKTYQELCLFFNWLVCLRKDSDLSFRLEVKIA